MAPEEAQSIIVLTVGENVEVAAPPVEVLDLLTDAPRGNFGYVRVLDVRGVEHWVNTNAVVQVHTPPT
jgi:hypothetical protein